MKTIAMIAVMCAALLLPACVAAVDDRVLIYYGYPSSFNYPTNQWDITLVAQDMAQYDIVVLGEGLEDPSHTDHANTVVIISQMPATVVYGYVTLNQPESDTMSKIGQWNDMGAAGVLLDEAGYDYGTDRAEFNRVVAYVHAQSSANVAFVNAWNPNHVMGTADDALYPNSVHNPDHVASHLTTNDYYLLESCPFYNGIPWMPIYTRMKCSKCVALKELYNVNIVSVSTIRNSHPRGHSLYNHHVWVANIYGFDAHGTSDLWYGASSSQVRMW